MGRVVPRSIKALKQYQPLQGNTARHEWDAEDESEQIWGIFFRYAEYCITAPLLFLAVVCLLVVDAPAW